MSAIAGQPGGGLFGTTQARREFGGQVPLTEHVSIDNAAENAADTTRNFMHFLNCKFPIVQKTKQEIRGGNRWRRRRLGNVFQAQNDGGVDLDGSHESKFRNENAPRELARAARGRMAGGFGHVLALVTNKPTSRGKEDTQKQTGQSLHPAPLGNWRSGSFAHAARVDRCSLCGRITWKQRAGNLRDKIRSEINDTTGPLQPGGSAQLLIRCVALEPISPYERFQSRQPTNSARSRWNGLARCFRHPVDKPLPTRCPGARSSGIGGRDPCLHDSSIPRDSRFLPDYQEWSLGPPLRVPRHRYNGMLASGN